MIAILDYKAGNQTSVFRALESMGMEAVITDDNAVLLSADGVIFPGVGAAGQAMDRLKSTGQDKILHRIVAEGIPLLGVCLGCQILLERSEENDTQTLGIIPGVCRRFQPEWTEEKDGSERIRIPHMGWNALHIKKESPLLEGIEDGAYVYFVHGYYPETSADLCIASCDYGCEFTALYGRNGLWAAQFHPEKSGKTGLRILENFYHYCKENRRMRNKS